MKHLAGLAACGLLFAICSCGPAAGPLPSGAKLGGFQDVDKPERYTGATLYTYMDGGADYYLHQGFSELYVRRYGQGSERFIVELYEMKEAQGASQIYQGSRHPNQERELAAGCLASIGSAEIQSAKGRYYLVVRNEDPLAKSSGSLIELSRHVLDTLPGSCAPARTR